MNYERRSAKKRRHTQPRRAGVSPGGYQGPEKRGFGDRREIADRRRKNSAQQMDYAVS